MIVIPAALEKEAIDYMWVIFCAILVFLMQAGFLCLEAGFTRRKNSINVAMKNLSDFAISSIIYWVCGFGVMFGMSKAGWVGTSIFFPNVQQYGAWVITVLLFQMMFCGTAVTIISGAVAERLRFNSYVVISIFVSGLIYPFFGHWAWGGLLIGQQGWLAARGFIDFSGATVVHSTGGWAALAILIIIGPREGRFPKARLAENMPGHSYPLAMLGVFLLWVGWFGFNGGGVLGFNDQIPLILLNTILAASAALGTSFAIIWVVYQRMDPKIMMSSILAGLVAITAGCHAVTAESSILIGAVATLVMVGGDLLLEKFKIDDVVGAVPVHAFCGAWGTLAVGLFGDLEILNTGLSRSQQVLAQSLGILVCFVFVSAVTVICIKLMGLFLQLRLDVDDELKGLNLAEHGISSAP